MNKFVQILLYAIVLYGCAGGKGAVVAGGEGATKNEPAAIEKSMEVRQYIKPDVSLWVSIDQRHLNEVGLSKPSSLLEISEWLSEEDRKYTHLIEANGENIYTLEGMELFPRLDRLNIYHSKIKNLKDMRSNYNRLKFLIIESGELEDISDIVSLEDLETLYIIASSKLKDFPDITHMDKLMTLGLHGCKGIDFSNLAAKLPSRIINIDLLDCGIGSLSEVSSLFNKCTILQLNVNPIEDFDPNMDFGRLEYVSLGICPIADKYFNPYDPLFKETDARFMIKNVYFDFVGRNEDVYLNGIRRAVRDGQL